MIQASCYLTIDQGGHASRAIIFNANAKIISQAECSIKTFTPQQDWVEHDANEVIQATQEAIIKAISGLDKQYHIKAAGLACQRSSIACWNKVTGQPLSPILSWQDRRQADWLVTYEKYNNAIHQKTGLFLSPHYGASKLRWCLDNVEAVAKAKTDNELVIGPMASLLGYHLTQQHTLVADPANASRTLLWNIHTHDWDDELLSLFGIERALLPPCSLNYGNFGFLDLEGDKIPLTIITGDQSAALFAWGQPEADTCYINIGTGAFIQRPQDCLPLHDQLLASLAYHDQNYHCYTQEGTVNGAASALQWFAEENKINNIEAHVSNALESDVTPPLFINTVSGLGSPDWQANLTPRFIGQGTQQAQCLAVLESIVFLILRNLTVMTTAGAAPSHLIVSGGLSRLDRLCQKLADLAEIAVIRPQEHEATATGLAYLLAGRPDSWSGINYQNKTFYPNNNHELKQRFSSWSQNLTAIINNNT